MKVKSADGSVTDDKSSPVTEGQNNSPVAGSWKSISDVAKERFTEENLRNHHLKRLKTGFAGLDDALGGGIYPGLIVLGGSPSVGKSTFALQIAESVAEQTPVLYFSMEMTRERIAAKFISRYLSEHREALGLDEDTLRSLTAAKLISGMPEQDPWGEIVLNAVEKARLHVESVTKKLFINVKRMNAKQMAEEV